MTNSSYKHFSEFPSWSLTRASTVFPNVRHHLFGGLTILSSIQNLLSRFTIDVENGKSWYLQYFSASRETSVLSLEMRLSSLEMSVSFLKMRIVSRKRVVTYF